MRKVVLLALILFIFLYALGQTDSGLADETSQTQDVVTLVESNSQQAIIQVEVADYTIRLQKFNGEDFHSLTVPGYGHVDEAGKPKLPVISFNLGIPVNCEIELYAKYLTEDKQLPGEYNLVRVPQPGILDEEFSPGQLTYYADFYESQSESLFPNGITRVADVGYLREQRFVRIEVFPFQYESSTGKLIIHSLLQVVVNFNVSSSIENYIKVRNLSTPSGNNVDDPFEAVLRSSILNYEQAKSWRGIPVRFDTIEASPEGARYRITVEEDGIYRLSSWDLQNAGIDTSLVDPRLLHMTNQGRDVAIYIAGEEDGSFDNEDYIIFYGQKFRGDYLASLHVDEAENWLSYVQQRADGTIGMWSPQFVPKMIEKYTDENIYWLFIDSTEIPARMNIADGMPGSASVPDRYTAVVHAEDDWRHWEYSFVTEDTWYWDWVRDNNVHVYTTTLSAIASEPFTATVRGEVVAFQYNLYNYPDHHTVVSLNGQEAIIDDAFWDGRSLYRFEKEIGSSVLLNGFNQINFQILPDSILYDSIFINWFEIEYQRSFMANADTIIFPGEHVGTWLYRTIGFTDSRIVALDITNPLLPRWISNASTEMMGDDYRVSFEVSHDAGAQFILSAEPSILTPKSISYYIPPDLKSSTNQADYIIITHPAFLAEAQHLADYRSSLGLHSIVVSVNDIYNEFNYGIYHPIAIKNFLRYTLESWQAPAPTYVVLVGDGHYNDKFVNPDLYGSLPIFMPANLGWVDPSQGEVDATNLLVTLVGDDILPDMIIGRMPVNTPEELTSIIEKTISYEQSTIAEWIRHNLFVSDNTPDSVGDFVAMTEDIILEYIPENFFADRIYLDTFEDLGACGTPIPGGPQCPNVNQAIIDSLTTTGYQILTYTGHAGIGNWAHELILVNSNISTLDNSGMLPVVIDLGCLDGYWFHPKNQPSLAETFIRTDGGGAVATFSPTGLGVATGHEALADGFLDSIYHQGLWALGTATLNAKLAVNDLGVFRDLINTYTIFGDPALRMVSPYSFIVSPGVDSMDGMAGSSIAYTIQLTNTSELNDIFEIALSGNLWTTTLSTDLIQLTSGESATLTVTVDIPDAVPGGSVDSAWIEVASRGDRSKIETAVLQTTANVYGVTVTPSNASQIGLPGSQVNYVLLVTNTSNSEDRFNIYVDGNIWPLLLNQEETGYIAAGESVPLSVTVNIPVNAIDYAEDMAVITVVSQTDQNRQANSYLETIARTYGARLLPESQFAGGVRGSQVIYTVGLENSGGFTDNYLVTLTSNSNWNVSPSSIQVGPVLPGSSHELTIIVDIPTFVNIGYVDITDILVVSESDPQVTVGGKLYTQVIQSPYLYIPVVYK